jgi:Na+/H+-dicarboxylate symporter
VSAVFKFLRSPLGLLLMLAAGALIGTTAPDFAVKFGNLGQIYLTLVSLVALPFVICATIFGLRQTLHDEHFAKRVGRIAIVFVSMLAASALLGIMVGLVGGPGRNLSPEARVSFSRLVEQEAGTVTDLHTEMHGASIQVTAKPVRDFVTHFVPDTVFSALAKDDYLGVLLIIIIFGTCVGLMPKEKTAAITGMLETGYRSCEVLIGWINNLLPLAVLCIVAWQVATANSSAIHAMLDFIAQFLAISGFLILTSGYYVYRQSGLGVMSFLTAFREPVLLSLTAGNTAAAIPNTIKTMTERLRFNRAMVELITPLGAMLLRTGPALFYALATLFLAQLYQAPLVLGDLFAIFGGAILISLLTAGQPGIGGAIFAAVSSSYLNLPFDVCLILLGAVDRVCEAPRNLLTLLSTCAATALICTGLMREQASAARDEHTPIDDGPIELTFSRPVIAALVLCLLLAGGMVAIAGAAVGVRASGIATTSCQLPK